MQSYEIFKSISPELRADIVGALFDAERKAYKSVVESLAPLFNVRPVFVMRMPPAKRHQWVGKSLARKSADSVADNVLQVWLSTGRKQMLVDFLDDLGIEHNEGLVESLPDPPAKEKISAAIENLLAKYPPPHVAVYLHAFQAMDIAGWPPLEEILSEDDRLKLDAPPQD